MRRLRYGLFLAGLVLFVAGPAKADTVSIDGTYYFANNDMEFLPTAER